MHLIDVRLTVNDCLDLFEKESEYIESHFGHDVFKYFVMPLFASYFPSFLRFIQVSDLEYELSDVKRLESLGDKLIYKDLSMSPSDELYTKFSYISMFSTEPQYLLREYFDTLKNDFKQELQHTLKTLSNYTRFLLEIMSSIIT